MNSQNILRKLFKDNSKYRDLFEISKDGVYITTVTGEIVDVNAAVLKMTGYSRKEFFQLRSVEHYVNRADREIFQMKIQKYGSVKDFLIRLKAKSGKHVYCLLTSTALRDKQKEIIGYHGIIRDVTSVIRKEQKIIGDRKKFRDLFESSPDPIFVESQDGILLDVNTAGCELHGKTKKELLGIHFIKLIPQKYQKSVKSNFDNFINGGNNRIESFSLGKNRVPVPVEILSNNIIYDDIPALLLHVRDISERKKTEEELKKSRDELRSLAEHLHHIREEESTRIARELHDELGQTVTVLKLELSYLKNRMGQALSKKEMIALQEKAGYMIKLVNSTIDSVRRISTHLRPAVLDDLGLIAAIEWFATDFENRTGIRCITRVKNIEEKLNTSDFSIAVFRIVQEALTNVIRHANAHHVEIDLEKRASDLFLKISDDGRGFNHSRKKPGRRGYGLIGMKERAWGIGANLSVNSVKNQGTTIMLKIPIGS